MAAMKELFSRLRLSGDEKTIAWNAAAGFLVKGGAILVNILLLRYYIRYFQNATVLGAWLTILSVLNWVLMFDLGIGNGLRNVLPAAIREKNDLLVRQYISSAYLFLARILLLTGVLGFFLIPLAPWNTLLNVPATLISRTVLCTCIRIVFAGMVLQMLLKILQSILYAFQKAWLVGLLTLLSNCIVLAAVWVMGSQTDESNLIRVSLVNVVAVNLPLLLATVLVFSRTLPRCAPSPAFYVKDYAHAIFKEGLVLFWLTLVFMVISYTNEFLIGYLTRPEYVVEFQAYNKIFSGISAFFIVLLAPIWSSVTKAKAEGRFIWINKLYRKMVLFSFGALLLSLLLIPTLQWVVDLWLGEGAISVDPRYALVFSCSCFLAVVHNVNTSFGNGFSYYRVQGLCMTIAALVDIPLAFVLVKATQSWIGVILANIIVLCPYNMLEPFFLRRRIAACATLQDSST